MSADLDLLFAAAREYADGVPLPDTAAVRRRGQRRQQTQRTAVVVAVVVAVVAAAGVGAALTGRRIGHPRPAVTPTPGHSVNFVPLQPIPDATVAYPGAGQQGGVFPLTAVAGDRAFVGWRQSDGAIRVGGIDLATGRPAWPVHTLGYYGDWNGMFAVPEALIVIGEHDDGRNGPDYTLFVVDPATGAVRWQREFSINSDGLEPYGSVLVYANGTDGVTSGLDWTTGKAKWSFHSPGGAPEQRITVNVGDTRLGEVTADRTLRVYDVTTGALTSTVPDVGSPADRYLASGGRLYVASGDRGYQVRAYDLDHPGAAVQAYSAPPDRRLEAIEPCGPGRVCLLDEVPTAGAGVDSTAEVAAIDVAARKQVWRKPAPGTGALIQLGDRILATGGRKGGTQNRLFDPSGRQLLQPEDQQGTALRLSSGSLLVFARQRETAAPDGGSLVRDTPVDGVIATDGSRVPLGRLSAFGFACSATERYLVCPTAQEFRVWRYAS
jgi:outer membrane protein assembly factor BamB